MANLGDKTVMSENTRTVAGDKPAVKGKKLYNESVGAQDKKRVEFLSGRYKGMVQDLPELRADRLIKAGKAKGVGNQKPPTPQEQVNAVDTSPRGKKTQED